MPSGENLIYAARKHLGVPYAIGPGVGKDPSGFDCSGLIWWACRELGVTIPHGSSAQITHAVPISVDAARGIPGALLWRDGHDGLSTGAGVIEARTPRVVEGAWTDTFDGGKTRWTHAGLIPGITYEEAPVRLRYPLDGGRVTSGFAKNRRHPVTGKFTTHLGADVGNGRGYGVDVLSPADGTVIDVVSGRRAGQSASSGRVFAPGRSGNAVVIRTGGGGVVVVSHVTPTVGVGARVTTGQCVGVTDRSGIQTGAHVHLEWWPTGRSASATDPGPLLYTPAAPITKPPTVTPPKQPPRPATKDQAAMLDLLGFTGTTAFQNAHALHPDGDMGPTTSNALQKEYDMSVQRIIDAVNAHIDKSTDNLAKHVNTRIDQLAGYRPTLDAALDEFQAPGRPDPVGVEVGHIKTKLERLDVQEVHFLLADGTRCVAWVGTGTWAKVPIDGVNTRHDGVNDHLKFNGTLAIQTWASIAGGDGVVQEPLAFGREVAWAYLPTVPDSAVEDVEPVDAVEAVDVPEQD